MVEISFFISPALLLTKKKILTENFDTLLYFAMVLEDMQGFFLILLCTVLTKASVHMVDGHLDFF